jgi:UDP-N-acetylmuramyl tripeptide synthase
LASLLIKDSSIFGKFDKDYLIFESDEFSLPQILENVKPDYLICLNLFRDQLDRYGELNSVAKKWKDAINNLNKKTVILLNADDPLISFLGNKIKNKVVYFGLEEKTNLDEVKHGADTIYCPRCNHALDFNKVYFSHLGDWRCRACKLRRKKLNISSFEFYPLYGIYNKYNTLAAVAVCREEKFNKEEILRGFKLFKPAFGRQEKIFYKGHEINLFLSKNPTSFNESLSTIKDLNGKNFLFVLNDRIPDGLDVSWIWDIGFERILGQDYNITVSGDRCFDIGLRLKYADIHYHVEQNLKTAIDKALEEIDKDEKLFILPNYSAMLDTRKILLGRKLL